MRIWLIGAVSCLLACDAFLKLNPSYCDDSLPCATGMWCDPIARQCVDGDSSAPLVLSAIAPAAAGRVGGSRVTLTGQGFRAGARVLFGGVDSPDVTFVSATELQAIVPGGSCGPSKVEVRNPDGLQVGRADLFGYHFDTLQFMVGPDIELANDGVWAVPNRIGKASAVDLLIGYASTPSLQKLTNNDMGGFPAQGRFGNTEAYLSGVARDLDSDTAIEYIVRSNLAVEVFRAFDHSSAYRINEMNRDMAIIDANLDGKLDIVTLSATADELVTFLQSSTLSYTTRIAIGIPNDNSSLFVADFNQDGLEDIAISSPNKGVLQFCFATSLGTTSCLMTSTYLAGGPRFMGMVDIDGAGGTALASVITESGIATLTIMDFPGNQPRVLSTMRLGKVPSKLLTEDMDCDGFRDIILYSQLGQPADIYINSRNGNFETSPKSIALGGGATLSSISMQIFNARTADNLPDIVTLSNYSMTSPALLRVFTNISQ